MTFGTLIETTVDEIVAFLDRRSVLRWTLASRAQLVHKFAWERVALDLKLRVTSSECARWVVLRRAAHQHVTRAHLECTSQLSAFERDSSACVLEIVSVSSYVQTTLRNTPIRLFVSRRCLWLCIADQARIHFSIVSRRGNRTRVTPEYAFIGRGEDWDALINTGFNLTSRRGRSYRLELHVHHFISPRSYSWKTVDCGRTSYSRYHHLKGVYNF
jgi:hypothetical protein